MKIVKINGKLKEKPDGLIIAGIVGFIPKMHICLVDYGNNRTKPLKKVIKKIWCKKLRNALKMCLCFDN